MGNWEDENIPEPLSIRNKKSRGKRKRLLTLQELEEGVVGVCSGKLINDESYETKRNRVAHFTLQIYTEKYSKFWNCRPKKWRKIADKSPGVLGCCSRASVQAEILGASIEDYIEAQFWFYNSAFSRPPKYSEIAAQGALLHYKQWRIARVRGEAFQVTVNQATGGIFNPKDTLPDVVLKYEMKVLERMAAQWGSEYKVWELFGRLGDEEVFSDVFKKTRCVWREIYIKKIGDLSNERR